MSQHLGRVYEVIGNIRYTIYPQCANCSNYVWDHVNERCLYLPLTYVRGNIGIAFNPTNKRANITQVQNLRTKRPPKWQAMYVNVDPSKVNNLIAQHAAVEAGTLKIF